MKNKQVNIKFPQTEATIDSLRHMLEENNSDYFIKYNVKETEELLPGTYIGENYNIIIDSIIEFGRYSQVGTYNEDKDAMIYRFRHSYNTLNSTKNVEYFMKEYDKNQFEIILKGILFGVDSKQLYGSNGVIRIISFNTMINTKR